MFSSFRVFVIIFFWVVPRYAGFTLRFNRFIRVGLNKISLVIRSHSDKLSVLNPHNVVPAGIGRHRGLTIPIGTHAVEVIIGVDRHHRMVFTPFILWFSLAFKVNSIDFQIPVGIAPWIIRYVYPKIAQTVRVVTIVGAEAIDIL